MNVTVIFGAKTKSFAGIINSALFDSIVDSVLMSEPAEFEEEEKVEDETFKETDNVFHGESI